MEKCTQPSAPFYEWDLIILGGLESIGFDMPCELSMGLGLVILSLLSVMGVWLIRRIFWG